MWDKLLCTLCWTLLSIKYPGQVSGFTPVVIDQPFPPQVIYQRADHVDLEVRYIIDNMAVMVAYNIMYKQSLTHLNCISQSMLLI